VIATWPPHPSPDGRWNSTIRASDDLCSLILTGSLMRLYFEAPNLGQPAFAMAVREKS
jgi:hypothetical protein